MISLTEYRWSWVRELRIRYHAWRAERLLTKAGKMHKRATELFKKAKEHTERAEELLMEAKW